MNRISALLSLVVLAFPLALRADTVTTYDITFTGVGTLPTSGSFTYDSTVPQFSNFIVDWDGFTFNLTASANNPNSFGGTPACIGSNTGAAAGFALLTDCTGAGNMAWEAVQAVNMVDFEFLADQAGCEAFGPCENIDDNYGIAPDPTPESGAGSFSITAVPPTTTVTPEPSGLLLFATGLAGCAGTALRRFRRKA